jgi:hypothetical protein
VRSSKIPIRFVVAPGVVILLAIAYFVDVDELAPMGSEVTSLIADR